MKYFSKISNGGTKLKFACVNENEVSKICLEINSQDEDIIIDAYYNVTDTLGDNYVPSTKEEFETAREHGESFISSFGEPTTFIGSRPSSRPHKVAL